MFHRNVVLKSHSIKNMIWRLEHKIFAICKFFFCKHIDYFKELVLTLLPAITLLNTFQSVSHEQEYTSSSNTETFRYSELQIWRPVQRLWIDPIFFDIRKLDKIQHLCRLTTVRCLFTNQRKARSTSGQFSPKLSYWKTLQATPASQLSMLQPQSPTGWGGGVALLVKFLSTNYMMSRVHFKLLLLSYF